MITFGINTFLFTGSFTNASVSLFPRFKSWGFDSVEIAMDNPEILDVSLVKGSLEKNGLLCASVCAAMGPGRDLRGTKLEQKGAVDYLKSCIRVLSGLGCSILAGPLYSVVGRAAQENQVDYQSQWNTVVKHLIELKFTLCILLLMF